MNRTLSEIFANPKEIESAMVSYFGDGSSATLFPPDFDYDVFYSLIYGRHGTDEVSVKGDDVSRWSVRFASILWQYGPAWWRSVQVQDELRNLSLEDLAKGSLQVSTQALNPASKPTETFEGLDMPKVDAVNAQATNQYRKSKADAYSSLLFLLKSDVTEPFLKRFDPLFKKVLHNAPCEECSYDY